MEKRASAQRIDRVARETLQLDFSMVAPPRLEFQSGQFITVRAGEGPNANRAYSIASTADRSDGFELVVKLLDGGAASSLLGGLRPGDTLDFTGPRGFFTLLAEHPGDVVFAVTGVGLAAAFPLLVETLRRGQEHGRVLFFWGLRTEADLFWTGRLAELATHARLEQHVCLSQPDAGWPGVQGRITEPILAALPGLVAPTFYAVGNGSMTQALTTALVARGVDRRKQIRTEQFYPVEEP